MLWSKVRFKAVFKRTPEELSSIIELFRKSFVLKSVDEN